MKRFGDRRLFRNFAVEFKSWGRGVELSRHDVLGIVFPQHYFPGKNRQNITTLGVACSLPCTGFYNLHVYRAKERRGLYSRLAGDALNSSIASRWCRPSFVVFTVECP